ncbi:MAG: hydrogenase iron-sulfur subunit [Candidatus Lokiarchaeota archaeon]|nr:hydrogenase iron-sulfur subunit [Candidatus Lokiarchaeota archaeon]
MATRNINYMKMLCKTLGISSERLEMHYVSAAEGARFADIATNFTKKLIELGPNPLKQKKE